MTSKTALAFEGPSIPHLKPYKGKDGRIEALELTSGGKTIACGRQHPSIERWNTSGEMIGDSWISGDPLANI